MKISKTKQIALLRDLRRKCGSYTVKEIMVMYVIAAIKYQMAHIHHIFPYHATWLVAI